MSAQELITEHLDLWTGAVTKKSASGRGSNGKVEQTGVKKLRELILGMAVQGKLTTREAHDEPASDLLQRISAKQTQLYTQGKIKKRKTLPSISIEEQYFHLPDNWEWTRLGALFDSIMSGGTPSKQNPRFWDGDIPWASVKDLGKTKHLDETQDYITEEGLKAGSKLADTGDVLICTRMGLGKVAICSKPIAINQDLKAVKVSPEVSLDYFFLAYTTLDITGTGTTVSGITQDKLLSYVIGLPPIEEQHRIVQKVDELMALCDRLEQQTSDQLEAHETLVDTLLGTLTQSKNATELADNWARLVAHFDTLFTTEQSIDKLKQTVLQLATAGKLVPFQRAPVPLKNILSFGPRNGFSPKESNYETGCRVLKLGATTKGWLDLLESKNVDIGNSVTPHLWLKKGDILIQRGNAANHVGCNVLLDSDYPNYIYPDLMMKVRVKEKVAIPGFVALYLSAPGARQFMWERMTGTSGTMPKISKKVVEDIPISLPDIETQKAVVQKVDELMTLCDKLKERLNQASETRCQLAETIVQQALS